MRVVSKAYGEEQAWAWESDGVEGYTIEAAERETTRHRRHPARSRTTPRKTNYDQFLSEYGLKDLIKRYSNYVRYPMRMEVEKTRQNCRSPKTPATTTSPQYEHYTEMETINSMVPIWTSAASPT